MCASFCRKHSFIKSDSTIILHFDLIALLYLVLFSAFFFNSFITIWLLYVKYLHVTKYFFKCQQHNATDVIHFFSTKSIFSIWIYFQEIGQNEKNKYLKNFYYTQKRVTLFCYQFEFKWIILLCQQNMDYLARY